MTTTKLFSMDYFPSLQSSEDWYERITSDDGAGKRILGLYLLQCFLSFGYGLVMGSYHGLWQAVAAGAKVSALFSLALIICFPALFIIQFILGSRLKLHQMVSIILSGVVLTTAIMVSFAPVVIIFLLTGGNY